MEWAAPRSNYYALLAAIFNPKLTSDKALNIFDIQFDNPKPRIKIVPSKEELENLHLKQGLTQTEIAGMYSVSQGIVSSWFKEYSIKAIKYKQFKKEIDDELFDELRAKGMKQRELAAVFNVTQPGISVYMKRRGIK